jgi:MOSC domain-containing protein YiiM
MGEILAVCISEVRGVRKHPVEQLHLIPNHGIEGDAHAGTWHRQVSLLAQESVDTLQSKIDFVLHSGDFAENVLTRGIDLKTLPVGIYLRLGTALCQVTQIGKECHADCAIRQQVGDCVMPREGIFVRVLEEGYARPGDEVKVLEAP